MNKQTYIALVALNVHHTMIMPGETVELTEAEAAGALAVNAITTPEAVEAAQQAQAAAAKAQAEAAKAAVPAPDPVTLAGKAPKAK